KLSQQIEKFENTLLQSHSVHFRNTRAILGYHDVGGAEMAYPSIGPCYEIATNLFVAYHLVDCVARHPSIVGLSVPPVPLNILRPTTWTAETLQHFKGWDVVREWPNTLQQARKIITSSPHLDKPSSLSPQSIQPSIILKLLLSLSSTHHAKKYYTICGNFEAAALHLSVLRDANWTFSSNTGIEGMDEQFLTKDLGESIDDQRLAKFIKNNATNMRVPLQLALMMSPIILLSTSTLYKKRPSQIDLWRLCTSIGNDKPDLLKNVELAIWKALWNISGHGDTEKELHQLVLSPEWKQWENATDINDGVFYFNPTSMSPFQTAFITELPDSPMNEDLTSPFKSLVQSSQSRLLIMAPPRQGETTTTENANGIENMDVDPAGGRSNDTQDDIAGGENEMYKTIGKKNNMDKVTSRSKKDKECMGKDVDMTVDTTDGCANNSVQLAGISPYNKAKMPSQLGLQSVPKRKGHTQSKPSASTVNNSESDNDDIIYMGMERRVFFTPREITLDLEQQVKIHWSTKKPVVFSATGKGYSIDLIAHNEETLATLDQIADMIKGKPKFLTDPKNSMIRILDREVYNSLGANDLLFILRDQHIVVKETDVTCPLRNGEPKEFRAALRGLGSLTAPRAVHDLSIVPENGDLNLRIRTGTLDQLYQASFKGINKILNVLDIPMEMKGMRDLEVSTDYIALFNTMGDWKSSRAFVVGHSRWALAATKGAFHGWHMASNGLGTYIETKCGAKLWLLARPKDPKYRSMHDTSFFLSDSYQFDSACSSVLDVEAIVLVPGTELIMRPNTLHMVYTPFDTVCHGGHFYSAGNMIDTLSAIIHAFVAGKTLTNANHVHTRLHLQQMISMYHKMYVDNAFIRTDLCMDHFPDFDDWFGIMNVFVLCIYAFLMNVLDHNTYFPTFQAAAKQIPMTPTQRTFWQKDDIYAMSYEERKACMHARGQALEIIAWFQDHFDVGHRDTIEKMETFFRKLLGHYCLEILSYKTAAAVLEHEGAPGCTVDDVRVQLMGVGSGPMNSYIQGMLQGKQEACGNLAPFLELDMHLVAKPQERSRGDAHDKLWSLGKSERDKIYLAVMKKMKQKPDDIGPVHKKYKTTAM
ncbi:hypothetical protein JR316_0011160, partial [Psilocybe cubensis]